MPKLESCLTEPLLFRRIFRRENIYNLVLLIEATILIRLIQNKDNRKNKRISIQARATIGSNGLSGDVLLIDFSSQGLGMLLDHNEIIDIGRKLNISLETATKPKTVQGIIKWVRKLKEEKLFDYAVGMELVDFDTFGYGNLLQHAET